MLNLDFMKICEIGRRENRSELPPQCATGAMEFQIRQIMVNASGFMDAGCDLFKIKNDEFVQWFNDYHCTIK